MNTNSNTYTIVYSMIIVVVVAFLLAFVFQALKSKQDANVALDKKKQILYSLNIRDLNDTQAAEAYQKNVLSDNVVNLDGTLQPFEAKDNESTAFKFNSSDYKNDRLALYICEVDGQRKYVIPVYGMGLWGPINGYVALNDDKQTVFGAYFNHEGETAGLGAEIKDDASWQAKFVGKKLFAGDNQDIALAVKKKVDDTETQVDAVTGATLTSDGVSAMLHDCLGKYIKFLQSKE
ncbi:MAG: NADH:ubiquinone reductase (Na(+)-transporting) subunit C [Prevotella sp.]|nr:NADH:ubiquinone reductase (Na(+)-transporting) subunit C [Prevotella sp.]